MNKKIWLINIHNDSDRISSFQGKYLALAPMKLTWHLLENWVDSENMKIFPMDYRKETKELAKEINSEVNNLLLDYIWFTTYVWNSEKTLEIVNELLSINDKVKVLLWWPNSVNIDLKWDRIIKVVWRWEEPLLNIMQGKDINISSDWFYEKEESAEEESCKKKTNIEENDWMYYSPEVLKRVKWIDWMDKSFGWYETGSWCPYKCGFCAYDFEKRWLNTHDISKVREEILNLKKLWVKNLFIIDPIFWIKKQRWKEILKMFNELVPEIELLIFARPEFLDDEYVDILAEANLKEIRIWIQTLNPDVPKWLRSNTLSLVNENLPKLSKKWIPWRAELIVWLIWDNMEWLKESYKNVVNNFDPRFLYWYHLTVIKNTLLGNHKDRFDQDDWVRANERGSAIESSSYTEEEMKEMLVYSNMLSSLHRYLKSNKPDIDINIDLLEWYMEKVWWISNEKNIDFFLKSDYVQAEKFWEKLF